MKNNSMHRQGGVSLSEKPHMPITLLGTELLPASGQTPPRLRIRLRLTSTSRHPRSLTVIADTSDERGSFLATQTAGADVPARGEAGLELTLALPRVQPYTVRLLLREDGATLDALTIPFTPARCTGLQPPTH